MTRASTCVSFFVSLTPQRCRACRARRPRTRRPRKCAWTSRRGPAPCRRPRAAPRRAGSGRTACCTSRFTSARAVSLSTRGRARAMSCPTSTMSASFMPRVVRAGVPTRMPEATMGEFVSKGMVFLLTVMPARSSAFSAALPVMPAREDVDEHQVVVGAAGDEAQAFAHAGSRPGPARWPRSAAGRP